MDQYSRLKNQPPFNAKAACDPLGIPLLTGGMVGTPYEMLCGARSLQKFTYDLFTIPDKIEAIMDHIVPHLSGPACQMAKDKGFPGVWVGGWRTASAMLSPKLWERFFWPYFVRLVNEVVDAGLIAILHMDQDWTRDLARFRELPKGREYFFRSFASTHRGGAITINRVACVQGCPVFCVISQDSYILIQFGH